MSKNIEDLTAKELRAILHSKEKEEFELADKNRKINYFKKMTKVGHLNQNMYEVNDSMDFNFPDPEDSISEDGIESYVNRLRSMFTLKLEKGSKVYMMPDKCCSNQHWYSEEMDYIGDKYWAIKYVENIEDYSA